MAGIPQTVGEMFPSKWLTVNDLSKPVQVTIERVEVKEFDDLHSGEKVHKPVIHFTGAKKALIGNKTQCLQLAQVCGSQRFAEWVGRAVVLSPGLARNKKPTIIVSAPAAKTYPKPTPNQPENGPQSGQKQAETGEKAG